MTNLFSTYYFFRLAIPRLWIRFIIIFFILIIEITLIAPKLCQGSEIIIRLSGDINYPGDFSVLSKNIQLKKVCFLGIGSKGKIDSDFLRLISNKGVPKGTYKVVPPLLKEKWPADGFKKNGALRLSIISGSGMAILNLADKRGLAIHARDFYPLLDGIVNKKTMISFYNDQLFEGLKKFWGPLRISNWDMGRLADSWVKMNRVAQKWKARVIEINPHEIKRFCKPPITKRTPD